MKKTKVRSVQCPKRKLKNHPDVVNGSVIGYGRQAGVPRYKCKLCGRVFTANIDKMTYRRRTKLPIINFAITCVARGFPIVVVAHILDVKPDTVSKWLKDYVPLLLAAEKPNDFRQVTGIMIKGDVINMLRRVIPSDKMDYESALEKGRATMKLMREEISPPRLPAFKDLTEQEAKAINARYHALVASMKKKST